jgi:hypothetical protein
MSDRGGLVRVVIADPFELSGQRVTGEIVDELVDDRARILIRLREPIAYKGRSYPYLVLAQRDGQVPRWPREVAGLGVQGEPTSQDDAWGTAHWRGGLGLVGTADLCR